MAFEDSLIGNDDFDPKVATESLVRDVTKEPLPVDLAPRMLNTRLARKLNEKQPGRIDYGVEPPTKPAASFPGVPAEDFVDPTVPTTQPASFPGVPVDEEPVKPPEEAKKTWGEMASDVGKGLQIGTIGLSQGLRELIDRIPGYGKDIGKTLDEFDKTHGFKVGEELEAEKKSLRASQSQRQQAAAKKDWWDEKKGWFGDAWSDPYAYMGGITESLPEEAATMLPALGIAKWAYRGALAVGKSVEVASKLAGRTAAISGAVSEGLFGGAHTAIDVREAMNALTPEVLATSEGYKALLASGKSPDEAKQALVEDAATRGFLMSGVITGLFGGMGDRAVARILTEKLGKKTISSTLKSGLAGALGEGVAEEFPQSYGQKVAENIAIRTGDPNRPMTEGALNEALGGLATGGIQGGAMGAGAHLTRETTPAAPAGPGLAPPGAPPGAPGAAPGAAPGTPPPGGPMPGAAPEDVSVDEFLRRAGAAPSPPPGAAAGGPSPIADPATMSDADLADAFHQARTDMGGISLDEILRAGGYGPDTVKQMDERAKVEEAIGIARAYKAEAAQQAPPGAEAPKTKPGETPQSVSGEPTPGSTATPPPVPPNQPSHADYATLRAYGYSDEDIANMPATQRSRELRDAKDTGIDAKQAMAKYPMPEQPAQPTGAPIDREGAAGTRPTRETPAQPKTAEDVKAAQPVEPKSPEQAKAENYPHAHVDLPQFGLTGKKNISIETGVGQTRHSTELGPDGKPKWSTVMEGVAYGRLKGTKGADGQPLDILLGPDPTSPHLFVIDQHDPSTAKFDEHKIVAGFRSKPEAVEAYARTYRDAGEGRIGHITPMGPEEFEAWRAGDTTKPLKPASSGPVKAEEAGQRPLTETTPSGEAAPKGSPPAGGLEAGGPESIIHKPDEGSVQKDTEKPAESQETVDITEATRQIETALGPDADTVLPVDISRGAEIITENPGIDPATAFGQAVAENAVEQGYLETAEAEEIYGPNIQQVLEAGRPVAPESGGKPEGEGAKAEEAPEAGRDETGVVPGGGKAGETPAAEAGAADHEPHAPSAKPDTEREAGRPAGRPATEVAADVEAADVADQVEQAKEGTEESKTVEGYLDYIQSEIDEGRYDAGLAPTKSLKEFREAAIARGWTLDSYGKGTALWSPDHKSVMFTEVSVKGNNVQVQWSEPGDVAKPGEEKSRAEVTVERARKKAATINEREAEREKEAFAKLEEERQQAELKAPTWAQILAHLPISKDGRTHETRIAFDLMKEITGKQKSPAFAKLTPEQKQELYDRVRTAPAEEAPARDEISDIWDEILGPEEAAAPQSGKPGAKPRTAGEAGKAAATKISKGAMEALKGLDELFSPKGKLGSGPTFDDETYAKAKPFFKKAAEEFAGAWKDMKEFAGLLAKALQDHMGWTMDRLRQLRPYLEQFTRDVRDGIVKFAKGVSDERPGTEVAGEKALDEVPAEQGAGAEGERPAEPSAARGGEPRPGRDRGATEEGVSGARGPRGGAAATDTAAAGGGGRRAGPRARRDGGRVSGESAATDRISPEDAANIPAINFRITDELALGQGSEAVKFRDNIAAIELVQAIDGEGRRATPDEQKTLARYVGWGGLANAFRDSEGNFKDEWRARGEELERLLSPEELRAARASTRNAHYTSKAVVDATWKAVKQLGFKGGLVLEPSAGSGNFLGLIPEDVAGASKFVAVEYDPTTARIAKLLYPQETVLHSGFHQVPLADGEFTLAIGNPPFGNESLRFQYNPAVTGLSIHNQFFLASLDALRPGGIQAMVVSRYLMDAQDPKAREMIALKANLLGAIRLPDTAFKENARTEVVTDILFLQRRTAADQERITKAFDDAKKSGKNLPWEMEWIHTMDVRDPLGGDHMKINKYFAKHSNRSMIVGQLERSGSMYGKQPEVNVTLPKGADFEALLNQAVERLPRNMLDTSQEVLDATAARHKGMSEALDIALQGFEPGHTYRSPDGKLMQVVERETPSGAFEATKRMVTPDSPWSRQLLMDKDGNWYSMEAAVDPEGKKVKQGKRNVYERKYYPDNKVPGSMRLGDAKFNKLGAIVNIRDLTKRQLVLEAEDAPSETMEGNRKKLAAAYNAFVAENGLLNDPANLRLVNDLPDGALVASLESGYREAITTAKAAKTGQTARPASAKPSAIMSRRVVMKYETPTSADSPADALSITLSEMGRVDMDRIATLLGKTPQEAIETMTEGDRPLLYRDPEAQTFETPNTYLSGNVTRKLLAAREAGLEKNVAALEKVQPERWSAENVTAILGSNWIPPKIYADFVNHLIGGNAVVNYSPATNAFSLVIPGRPDRAKYEQWSTKERSADEILGGMLNSRVPKVMTEDADGNKRVDQEASALVAQKAREIENEFADWVFQDTARRNQLVDIYNDKFNTRVTRQHDGSHLTLPGKVPDQVIKLRRHQKNAVWRGIYEKTMLLDHVVGAGKTFTAIARAMERRRMGLSRKPTIVVPNHLVDQWAADVYRLYPAAKVLAAGKNQFDSKNRRRLFAKIATGDWDVVIIPHSSFGFIGIAPETEQRFLDHELKLAEQAIKDAEEEAAAQGIGGGRMKPFTVKQAEALAEKIKNRMDRLKKPKERMLTFEQMGIDDLTVDEAHEFKNLFYSSRLTGVSGMGNPAGSQKAFDLYNKIRALRENPNGTITFMTGTPISNSAVEMYTMMRYLMPEELKELGLEHFDAWRTQSVSAAAKYEPTASGGLKEVTRLGRTWSNMRSLMELYYSFTDAVSQDDINKAYAEDNNGARFPIPKVKGGGRKEVVVKPTPEQTRILMEVVSAFNALPSISDPIQRNAERLRLMDRARKVSLDARAVDPRLPTTEPGGKLEQIAANVVRIYNETTKDVGTQLVFLDRSVPKSKGDDKLLKEYDELIKKRDAAEAAGDETAYRRVIESLDEFDVDEIKSMRDAQAGGWNAYDQLKQNLIAAGIPAKEIRFVQEANNDLEKKALFDSVNAGETRVLIGSTPRMGAGTNVQERIVGLHHADVTWKPSDIEQREGRGIRQGNELLQKYGADNFELEILAYVTERTVDAKMWDLNATKLRMINGIRNYDGSFNMEFADEDAVGMAEIAALASGDPMLMERVKLQSEIEKTELLERAHRRKQFGIEDTIHDLENAAQNYPARIERGQALAKEVQAGLDAMDAAAKARTVEFNGTTYTHEQKAEARTAIEAAIDEQQAGDKTAKYLVMVGGRRVTSQDALTDVLADTLGDPVPIEVTIGADTLGSRTKIAQKLTAAMQGIVGEKSQTVGTMAGYDLVVGKQTLENGSTNLSMTLERDGKAVVDVERVAKQIETAQVRTLFDKLYAETKDTAAFTGTWMQTKIDEAKERLPNLLEQRGKPFAEAAKLKGLRDRLAEVTAILDARTKEAEGQARPEAEDDEEALSMIGVGRPLLPDWTADEAQAITDAVKRLVAHRLGNTVAVRFLEGPVPEVGKEWGTAGTETIAYYKAWSRVIAFSLRPDIGRLASHEINHAIYELLLTDTERARMDKEVPMLRHRIKAYAAEKYSLSREQADAIAPIEVIAIANEMYDQDRLGAGVHVGIRRIFEKIKQFLRDLAAAVRRAVGRQRADDIFSKIYEGGYRNAPLNPVPEAVPTAGFQPMTYTEELAKARVVRGDYGRNMIGPQQPADVVMDRLLREFMAPVPPKQPPPAPAKPGEEPTRSAIGPGGRTGPPVLPETIEAQLRARSYTKLADIASKTGIGKLNTVEARTKIQDRFIRLRNVEQSVPNYMSALSTYQAEALSHGRTGERLEDLENRRLDPLVQAIHDAGFTLGQTNALLYARHAFERNAYIDTINPAMNGEGSGMSNAEATAILSSLTPTQARDFDRIGAMVDAINAETRANLVAYGLISQDTADRWANQYRFYVPLRGFAEASENDVNEPMVGLSFDQRARVTKEALGRQSLAEGPLQYVMMQAESAIVRGERNRVGNTFLRFVQSNPDPVRWQVDAPELKRRRDPRTGMVTYYADFRAHLDPNAFVTRVGGKPRVIRLYGRDGMNIARALKGMETTPMNAVMRGLQMLTTVQARLATQWNPEFMLSNFFRDLGEAFINLNEQQQAHFINRFARHVGPSLGGIMRELYNPGSGGVYGAAFREFDQAGGRVRFFGLSDPADIARNINKRMRRLEGGVFNNILGAAHAAGDAIEMINGAVENSTRLAAYMAARDVGMSIPESAMLARNVTVDFNKKGEWGQVANTLYMFGNARIQGTARMGRALQHKKVRRAAYALAALGAISALYSILAGGDDDDGDAYYSKIPHWVRDKNLIIMWPKGWGADGAYAKIPVPFGFAPLYVLGARAMAVAMGKDKVSEAGHALLMSVADAFNPVGEESSLLAMLVPSLLRPAYHIATNQNWTGRPLYPDRDYNKQAPDSTKTFRSTSEFSKRAAETMNAITGGSKYKAGWVDVHPGSIDHVLEAVTGGVGRFASGLVKTGAMALNGEFDATKTPILRRFVGSAKDPQADAAAYYKARDEAEKAGSVNLRTAIKDRSKPGAEGAAADAYIREHPQAAQADAIFKNAETAMKPLRQARDRAEAEKNKAELDRVTERMRQIQNEARKRYRALQASL